MSCSVLLANPNIERIMHHTNERYLVERNDGVILFKTLDDFQTLYNHLSFDPTLIPPHLTAIQPNAYKLGGGPQYREAMRSSLHYLLLWTELHSPMVFRSFVKLPQEDNILVIPKQAPPPVVVWLHWSSVELFLSLSLVWYAAFAIMAASNCYSEILSVKNSLVSTQPVMETIRVPLDNNDDEKEGNKPSSCMSILFFLVYLTSIGLFQQMLDKQRSDQHQAVFSDSDEEKKKDTETIITVVELAYENTDSSSSSEEDSFENGTTTTSDSTDVSLMEEEEEKQQHPRTLWTFDSKHPEHEKEEESQKNEEDKDVWFADEFETGEFVLKATVSVAIVVGLVSLVKRTMKYW